MGELQQRLKKLVDIACSSDTPDFLDIARWQFDADLNVIVESMRQEFEAIYPEDYLGGTLDEWIIALEKVIAVTEETAKRHGLNYRKDDHKKLAVLKWFVKWLK